MTDVSLIMPAWRPRPAWLREAVTSALDEDACEIELIVVDDGSDEPVAALLAEVDDPRLRVVEVSHRGPYAARDAGLAIASGDFIRFVDSDDVVEPGSSGRLLALAGRSGDAAYGATLMCGEDLRPVRTVTAHEEGWVAEACVLGGFDAYVVSILFPRAAVERAGPWAEVPFAVSGDWDFVLRALEQAPVRRLDEVVTRYRRHDDSVTGSADVAAGAEAARLVIGRYFDRHPEQRGGDLERRAYVRAHLDRARAHAWVGDRAMAGASWRPRRNAIRRPPATAAARWAVERAVAAIRRVAKRGRR